jgi:hypothetical protein
MVICSLLTFSEMSPKPTSDNANFADNWHKWHKKKCAIAEIAAIYAIPVIFRNVRPLGAA